MTKNERSLQWVIAGIFFVVCFAFFQWIYPNHLFFKEQMRIFLYTTDYFISFWDEPAWLSCYVEFLDTVLPFDCDRPVNRDVRVVALMVLLYAGFTQVREW